MCCKYCVNNICTHTQCGLYSDVCVVADIPNVCKYESRKESLTYAQKKEYLSLYKTTDDESIKSDIKKVIFKIKDKTLKAILYFHIIDGCTMEEIAKLIHYDVRSVYRLKVKAITNLKL